MQIKDISYQCGSKTLTGYLADGARGKKAPGILICHQGGGLRDHEKERARMLAELGYVAFALDMYGTVATRMEEAMPLMSALVQNPPELRARAEAGLGVLKSQPNTDTSRLAAIGFCFGGGTVIELARCMPELACVVAFHPGLTGQNALPARDERPVKPKVMVCAGQLDPLITADAREHFIKSMTEAGADYQLIVYGQAGHSFTDKSVDALNVPNFKYHAPTDRRSWTAMRDLFDETLGQT